MNILILSNSFFPEGEAMSTRWLTFSKLLKQLGFNVYVISLYSKEKNGSFEDVCSYESISQSVERFDYYTLPKRLYNSCKTYIKKNRVDIIFMGRMFFGFKSFRKLTKKHNIPLIIEQCEWLDKTNFKFKKMHPLYIANCLNINCFYKKADGIVCISRFFEDFYKKKGCKTIRIPAILDSGNIEYKAHLLNSPLKIAFFGSLGGTKDLLDDFLIAFNEYHSLNKAFQFHIYGPSQADIDNLLVKNGISYSTRESIFIHGKMSHKETLSAVMNSDFTFFARSNRRSSQAGFPTKFAESMALGTPVITNLTGDISLFLRDGVNGFVLNDLKKESFFNIFDKITMLSDDEKAAMRAEARKTAELNFDYKNYCAQFDSFLNKLLK